VAQGCLHVLFSNPSQRPVVDVLALVPQHSVAATGVCYYITHLGTAKYQLEPEPPQRPGAEIQGRQRKVIAVPDVLAVGVGLQDGPCVDLAVRLVLESGHQVVDWGHLDTLTWRDVHNSSPRR
jgi:hypothetical protein